MCLDILRPNYILILIFIILVFIPGIYIPKLTKTKSPFFFKTADKLPACAMISDDGPKVNQLLLWVKGRQCLFVPGSTCFNKMYTPLLEQRGWSGKREGLIVIAEIIVSGHRCRIGILDKLTYFKVCCCCCCCFCLFVCFCFCFLFNYIKNLSTGSGSLCHKTLSPIKTQHLLM